MSTQKDHANGFNWSELNQPRILSPDQWENNQYLLFEELNRCFKTIKEFSSSHEEYKRNRKHSVPFELPMNIGIIGDRGTGKTSILKSLKLKLEKENYFVFDIMDPNTLSSELTVLEILISNIYHHVVEQNLHTNNCGSFECNTTRIMQLFKKIMSTLAIKRQKSDFLKKDNPDIEIVEKIGNIVNLDQTIVDLLDAFVEYERSRRNEEKYTDLVLIIDDLDLTENKYAHKLISEIQEYLNTKIIIVLAYNDKQLEESILENKIRNNQLLLDEKVVEVNTLRKQTEHLLLKLIASNNRIYLYNQSELLRKQYIEVFKSLGIDEKLLYEMLNDYHLHYEPAQDEKNAKKINIEDWFYNRAQYLTKIYIKPVNEKEPANMLLPANLREFIHFVNIFVKSKKLPPDVNTISKDRNEENDALFNLNLFKEYFLAKSQHILEHQEHELLDSWLFADSHQKNYLVYKYFYDCFQNMDGTLKNQLDIEFNKYPFDLAGAENYNLRLGDIYAIMELFSRYIARSSKDFYVVYFFKVLYSLEMTSLLISSYQNLSTFAKNNTDDYMHHYQMVTGTILFEKAVDEFEKKVEMFEKFFGLENKIKEFEKNIDLIESLHDKPSKEIERKKEQIEKFKIEAENKKEKVNIKKDDINIKRGDIIDIKNNIIAVKQDSNSLEAILDNTVQEQEYLSEEFVNFINECNKEFNRLFMELSEELEELNTNDKKKKRYVELQEQYIEQQNQYIESQKKYITNQKQFITEQRDFIKVHRKHAIDLEQYNFNKNISLVKYLKLINTSFMPDYFNYLSYSDTKNEERYLVKEIDQDFIDFFITSTFSTGSHIVDAYKSHQSIFRYRPKYKFGMIENDNIKNSNTYTYEFYVPLVKSLNIILSLMEYLEKNKEYHFLFYSMFQIDCFVRKNTGDNKKTAAIYAIKTINSIFSDYNNTKPAHRVIELEDKYFSPIFADYNNHNIKYRSPYPEYKFYKFKKSLLKSEIGGFSFEIVGDIEGNLDEVTIIFQGNNSIPIKDKGSVKKIVKKLKEGEEQFSDKTKKVLKKLITLQEYNSKAWFSNKNLQQCVRELLNALKEEAMDNSIKNMLVAKEDEHEDA